LLSQGVELLLVGRDVPRLLFQPWQIFLPHRQQHLPEAVLINGRICNPHVISHQLRDDEIRLEQESERERGNQSRAQHGQPCRANRTVLVWADHAHCASFRAHGGHQNIAAPHQLARPAGSLLYFHAV
jgi:hypothetical protein